MRNRLTHAWQAAAFTYDLVAGDRETWVKRAAGAVVKRACEQTARGRSIRYDRYSVERHGGRRPAIIVTHGFTHEGHDDPRLQALCARLARVGFVVIAPEFDDMRHYRLGLGDLADLEAAVAVTKSDAGTDASRIGVIAFSFGAAPTLLGLAREPLKDDVAFAVIFGGYFDLKRAFKYVLTGAYDGFGHAGRLPVPETGDDRWKFLAGNLNMVQPSPTSGSFAAAVARRIADPLEPVDTTGWSAHEQAAWALIDNREPDRFEELYRAAGPHLDEWATRLSASGTAHHIRAKLVLVHSFTDQKTPFIESIAMSQGVPNAPPPLLVLLNAFAHVDLTLNWRSIRSMVRDGLPGLFSVWRVVYRVMREARI